VVVVSDQDRLRLGFLLRCTLSIAHPSFFVIASVVVSIPKISSMSPARRASGFPSLGDPDPWSSQSYSGSNFKLVCQLSSGPNSSSSELNVQERVTRGPLTPG